MKECNDNQYTKNLNHLRAAFENAAFQYDKYSILQRTIADRLDESLEQIKINPITILDLGSGTGYGSQILHKRFRNSYIYQIDLSENMLKVSKKKSPAFFSKDHFVCADINKPPFKEKYFDLIFSNLTLQWCDNLDLVFNEVKYLLKDKGVFLFSSFGPDSLKELRECWASVDDYVHINAFVDMHDVADALMRVGLMSPILNMENITLTYNDCRQLMKELKYIGAHNINNGRRKTLTGKKRLEKVFQRYESYRVNGVLPATYEVIYGHAWQSAAIKKEQAITLDDFKKQVKG